MKTETQYTLVRLRSLGGSQVEKYKIPTSGWHGWEDLVAEVPSLVDLENYRYFWFEDVVQTKIVEDGMITFKINPWQVSGKYFVNAYIEEYEDVLVNNKDLAKQMTNLSWTHIVRNIGVKTYWTEHFDPDNDKLISLEGIVQ